MQFPAAEGPYFDELAVGQEFGRAPGLTLTPGLAAAHQAITGDRLPPGLDHELGHPATRRTPRLGDTLRTSTRVVALRQNRPREGRAPTGLAELRITTVDQQRRPVLDFWRCAM